MIMEKMSNTYELPPLDMIGWYVKSIFSSGIKIRAIIDSEFG
jgi:hypothetical protein